MKYRRILFSLSGCALAGSFFLAGNVLAHGPTPQKTDESIQLKAPPELVWQKIKMPCAMAEWHPELVKCEALNEKQQRLTLKNGKNILLETDELSDAEMTWAFRFGGEVDIEALPVSSLNGKIRIQPDAAGSKLAWMARYYRAFTGNEPPAGQDDESAKSAIDQFVKSGLAALDKSLQ